jgi:hypothetical protein
MILSELVRLAVVGPSGTPGPSGPSFALLASLRLVSKTGRHLVDARLRQERPHHDVFWRGMARMPVRRVWLRRDTDTFMVIERNRDSDTVVASAFELGAVQEMLSGFPKLHATVEMDHVPLADLYRRVAALRGLRSLGTLMAPFAALCFDVRAQAAEQGDPNPAVFYVPPPPPTQLKMLVWGTNLYCGGYM